METILMWLGIGAILYFLINTYEAFECKKKYKDMEKQLDKYRDDFNKLFMDKITKDTLKCKWEVEFPYKKAGSLLTDQEIKFYNVLREIIKDDFEIHLKPRIADLVEVTVEKNDSTETKDEFYYQLMRIAQKHIDFVICDSKNMHIIFAIELDDSSHNRKDRIDRDKFVNELFSSCQIPLIRFPVEVEYEEVKVINTLESNLREQKLEGQFFNCNYATTITNNKSFDQQLEELLVESKQYKTRYCEEFDDISSYEMYGCFEEIKDEDIPF